MSSKLGFELRLMCVVSKINLAYIQDLIIYAIDNRVSSIIFREVLVAGLDDKALRDELALSTDDVKQFYKIINRYESKIKLKFFSVNKELN